MSQKNFKQMSTKKLNALMETASEEEKAQIQEVLNMRNAASAGAEAIAPEHDGLTLEEQEAIAKAEAESGTTEKKPAATKEKAPKMTDEEREELANKLRAEAHEQGNVRSQDRRWPQGC